jgi:rhomboid protease GluP
MALDIPYAFEWKGLFNSFGPSPQALADLGMGGQIPLLQGRWWTLLTATYLHSGILHILFNMLWLRRLGPLVEELYGPSRFLILYTAAGIMGAGVSTIAGTFYFVGASGAVFGLFGALVYYGYRRGGVYGRDIFRQMLVFAALGFFMGFAVSNVDNWGHLGGLLGGALFGFLLGYSERQIAKWYHHVLALACLVLILIVFLIVLIQFIPIGNIV